MYNNMYYYHFYAIVQNQVCSITRIAFALQSVKVSDKSQILTSPTVIMRLHFIPDLLCVVR